jgi:hypothetical protein
LQVGGEALQALDAQVVRVIDLQNGVFLPLSDETECAANPCNVTLAWNRNHPVPVQNHPGLEPK